VYSTATKKRSTLRLLTELFLAGVIKDADGIISAIKDLFKNQENTFESIFTTLSLIVSFLRYGGEEFVGVIAKKQQALVELADMKLKPREPIIDADQRKACAQLFQQYFEAVAIKCVPTYHSLLFAGGCSLPVV
jgi:hypothetical protein